MSDNKINPQDLGEKIVKELKLLSVPVPKTVLSTVNWRRWLISS